jgi:hypothetical protein
MSFANAASLQVHVQNSKIDLDAKQVPLIDLLRTISEKTDIVIESRDSLTELVSLNLNGASIEHCLRRLLGNRNYALTYKKTEDNRIIPASMHIFGSGSVTLIKPESKIELPILTPEDPLKKIEKKFVEQAFADANMLAKQISAKFMSSGPEGSGIKLTRVPKNSFFSDIGLKDGDIVQDVNGEQVETAEEFVEALQAATEEQNMIRIARIKNNNMMDPIYIELH